MDKLLYVPVEEDRSLRELAEHARDSGLLPLIIVPDLYDLRPETTCEEMGSAIIEVWGKEIATRQILTESLQACEKKSGEPAYSQDEIKRVVDKLFVSDRPSPPTLIEF